MTGMRNLKKKNKKDKKKWKWKKRKHCCNVHFTTDRSSPSGERNSSKILSGSEDANRFSTFAGWSDNGV